MNQPRLPQAIADLESQLRRVDLPLEVPGVDEARLTLRELVGQLNDYLLPRLRELDAPLLAVVGGSTGAGKSTLVNSFVGAVVSAAGVLRPTTTTPVLVSHPEDLSWFEGDRVLPGLPRSSGAPPSGAKVLHLVADADVPRGLALLDAPDIDSVVKANREMASQLLTAADLWLFVTTAARYADAVPWEFLRRARARSTALALVLNRVPREAMDEVPAHLAEMLRREGLDDAPVLTVAEVDLDEGLVPGPALEPVAAWLRSLALDSRARSEAVGRTLEGALDSLPGRVGVVAGQLEAQIAAGGALADEVDRAYEQAAREVDEGLSGGALLRTEVLARWHEFVGTGEVMRNLQNVIGRFRDRVNEVLSGQPPIEREIRNEVERGIETVFLAAADKAVERTLATWKATPYGRSLIAQGRVPQRSSPQLAAAVETQVRAWQGKVLELVRAQGASKRAAGRVVSIGVNAVGAALMIVVFAHTGGLTGGEVAIAGGTAALSQRLLEAMFGDEAVRNLTASARAELMNGLHRLLDAEAARFSAVAKAASPHAGDVRALRSALDEVRAART